MQSEEKVRIHTNFFLNMLHLLIIKVKVSSVNKAEIRKCLIRTNVILRFGLLIDHIGNIKMDALTSFIVVIIAITIQFSLYAIKRLQEPLEPNYLIDKNSKNKNYMGKFWKNAEITNGRLAMIGFLALIINYGFFGWIIPGFI